MKNSSRRSCAVALVWILLILQMLILDSEHVAAQEDRAQEIAASNEEIGSGKASGEEIGSNPVQIAALDEEIGSGRVSDGDIGSRTVQNGVFDEKIGSERVSEEEIGSEKVEIGSDKVGNEQNDVENMDEGAAEIQADKDEAEDVDNVSSGEQQDVRNSTEGDADDVKDEEQVDDDESPAEQEEKPSDAIDSTEQISDVPPLGLSEKPSDAIDSTEQISDVSPLGLSEKGPEVEIIRNSTDDKKVSPTGRVPPLSLTEYRKSKTVTAMELAHHCDEKRIRHRREPGGDEYNFASASHGAKLVAANKESKGAHNILHNDKEKYYRSPCSADIFVVVELSEETLIDVFVVANFELYSSNVKEFELFGSLTYPTEEWSFLGRFEAENARQAQKFKLSKPQWVRYLKMRMVSHYGTEFYCTLSMVEVYGIDAIECLLEEWLDPPTPSRTFKESSLVPNDEKIAPNDYIMANDAQPSRLGDSVMKLIMQKVKALEMNQALFDKYVEDLNSNYKDHFSDFERELEAVHHVLKNLTASLSNMISIVQRMEAEREIMWKSLQGKLESHVNNEAAHRDFLRNQMQHMENRETVAMAVAIGVILLSSFLHIFGRYLKCYSLDWLLFCTGSIFAIILSA